MKPSKPLTEQEKFLIAGWMQIPGSSIKQCPKRVDPAIWRSLDNTAKMRLAYSEWVHQMMLEGRL